MDEKLETFMILLLGIEELPTGSTGSPQWEF
jgi:hypothetical protein